MGGSFSKLNMDLGFNKGDVFCGCKMSCEDYEKKDKNSNKEKPEVEIEVDNDGNTK